MYVIKGWYLPDIDSHFASSVGQFPNTSYQQSALDAAFQHVKNFNLAIDIGANVGLHSVRLSQKFNSVVSFEPTSLNYECLNENTKSFSNVVLHKTGLGEVVSNEVIKLPSIANNCGAFSIVDFNDYKEDLITETITIETLDSFSLNPDFIKIDTQGFELNVLKGGLQTLQTKPVLLLECETKSQFRPLESLLNSLGYTKVESIKKDTVWICK